jgi:DNA invertase Pin-like site-specific DNA recombinase
MKKIVSYIRGSTEKQQNTLQAQDEAIRKYCPAFDLELVRAFPDSGTSAQKTRFFERPVVMEMLDYMRENDIQQFVFYKLDRVFRNLRDAVNSIHELQRRRIDFHSTYDRIDTTTAMGRAMMNFTLVLGELENDTRAERQRAAFHVMRSNNHRCGAVPFGWQVIPAARMSRTGRQAENLAPDPSQQLTLAAMQEMRGRGVGFSAIARWLNGEAIPSATGGLWHPSTVHSVLTHAKESVQQ